MKPAFLVLDLLRVLFAVVAVGLFGAFWLPLLLFIAVVGSRCDLSGGTTSTTSTSPTDGGRGADPSPQPAL